MDGESRNYGQMTKDQTDHLNRIEAEVSRLIIDKYRRGQAEHGGNLWEKMGLLDMAIDEAIDQVVYLLTLKEQVKSVQVELGFRTDDDASADD